MALYIKYYYYTDKILFKFCQQQLVMVYYACGCNLNQKQGNILNGHLVSLL